MQAWVSCPEGRTAVIHTPWVAISVLSSMAPTYSTVQRGDEADRSACTSQGEVSGDRRAERRERDLRENTSELLANSPLRCLPNVDVAVCMDFNI